MAASALRADSTLSPTMYLPETKSQLIPKIRHGRLPNGLMIPGPGEDNDDNDDSCRTKALALAQCHLRHRDRLSSQTARQFYFYPCRFLQPKSQQINISFTALFHPFKSFV